MRLHFVLLKLTFGHRTIRKLKLGPHNLLTQQEVMTDLLEPVSDLHDEQKLLKYLPHVLKYQDDTFQDRNLPVPDLQKTLDKYLKTLEPILNLAQMKRANKVQGNIFFSSQEEALISFNGPMTTILECLHEQATKVSLI